MNPEDKFHFDEIAEGQRHLHQLMARLDDRVETLRQRLERAERKESPPLRAAAPSPITAAVEPPPLPVQPPPYQRVGPVLTPPPPKAAVSGPPPLPVRPDPPASAAAPPKERQSFELQLGTFWLVRVGIVIFLTGLVFLGNFAYHRFIADLGAPGKLALLYLAGGTLMATGAWLERKREAMRNYARVLLAGGAAAIYYTTYAAHYVERLRVIESPIIGGTLLLGLAGGIVWLAERRRSETLALLAVLLAYYTSAINPIGAFTLFSSVLLTAIAVFFLLRHGWSRLSWASLIGTYGSYAFWRFHNLVADPVSGSTQFGPTFLTGYWILFTAAIFIGQSKGLRPAERMPFLTANNAAFFAFAAHHFAVHRPGSFWAFALGFGMVLLGLAALASRRFRDDPALDGACLAQGLTLVIVGLAAKLTGYQLALTFAAESVVLLSCSRWRHATLYRLAAALTAVAATFVAFVEIDRSIALAIPLGATVSALLLFDAWLLKRLRGELAAFRFEVGSAWFAVLGLTVAGFVIWEKTSQPWQPAGIASAALICALSLPFVRLPEVALLGQAFFAMGVMTFLGRDDQPAITCTPIIVAALALEQWWQRQRTFSVRTESRLGLQFGCAMGAVALGLWWMQHFAIGDAYMVAASLAALGAFCYALATRATGTFLAGHLFTFVAVGAFAMRTASGHPDWLAALTPIIVLCAMTFGAQRFGRVAFPEIDQGVSFAAIAAAYRVLAVILAGAWIFEYVPVEWQMPFFAAIGATLLVLGGHSRNRSRIIAGAALSVLALALSWARFDVPVTLPQLAAIVVIPAAARWAARHGEAEHALSRNGQNFLVASALATVWLWVTRWTLDNVDAANLTVAWSVLALVVFVGGFALRERIYRLGGLTILTLAVGRIFLIDVWQLETIYRILSFLVLGAVLLVLGFAYNRFAESLRRWL